VIDWNWTLAFLLGGNVAVLWAAYWFYRKGDKAWKETIKLLDESNAERERDLNVKQH
jgi:hypothetical protein